MIRKLLVPTDASPLSERAVPIAIEIAATHHAEIELVQVVQYLSWLDMGVGVEGYVDPTIYQEVMDALDEGARRNLQTLAARARGRGVPAEENLLHGSPGAALLEFEAESRPDLVVMATLGRTGLARFARGSVADLLVRQGTAPVLLVPSFGPQPTTLKRAVVPLDGSALAEEAVPMVEALALKPLTHAHLCQAVDSDEERHDAVEYLARMAGRLRLSGLDVTIGTAVGPAHEVIAMIADGTDVVIMATHGRGGYDRFRHGSVAERLLREVT